jgi:hypothetical protein
MAAWKETNKENMKEAANNLPQDLTFAQRSFMVLIGGRWAHSQADYIYVIAGPEKARFRIGDWHAAPLFGIEQLVEMRVPWIHARSAARRADNVALVASSDRDQLVRREIDMLFP